MSTDVTEISRGPADAAVSFSGARLPRWFPYACGAVSIAIGWPISRLFDGNVAAWGLATAVVYLIGTTAVSRVVEGRRRSTDRFMTTMVSAAFALATIPLVSLVWTILQHGLERLDGDFFTNTMRGVVGAGGGAMHAILGTVLVTALTCAIAVPVGIMCAIYLVEYGRGRLRQAITFFVDVMTGIPSIVAGLFAVALFTILLGPGTRSALVGSVALSVLMIPIVVRSTEEMLKLVPNELREAALALGVPKWRSIVKVVIPTATAGIATGVTLAIARIVGETAPLLVTVGITTGVNWNPFEGRVATLPVFAFYQVTQPGVPPQPSIDRAWTAALVLVAAVMILNLSARLISRLFSPKIPR